MILYFYVLSFNLFCLNKSVSIKFLFRKGFNQIKQVELSIPITLKCVEHRVLVLIWTLTECGCWNEFKWNVCVMLYVGFWLFRLRPSGEAPSPRAAHAAAAIDSMVVFQVFRLIAMFRFVLIYIFQILNLTFWSNVWYVSAALLGGSRALWSTNWWPLCAWHDQMQVVQVVLLCYYPVSISCLDSWILSWFVLSCRVVVQGQGPGPRYGHVMEVVAQRYLVSISGNDGEFNLLAFKFFFIKV